MQTIRGGLKSERYAWTNGMDVVTIPPTRAEKRPRPAEETDHLVHELGDAPSQKPEETPLASRQQTRTLMATYGWTIKHFKDLTELVSCLRDAIQGVCTNRGVWCLSNAFRL